MNSGLSNKSIDNKDRNLLGLAVKCRLISIEQEKQILSVFIDEIDINPDVSIVQIFREINYLSEEEIKFLFAIQKHLKMKLLDKKFGELGIANKFINPEKVKKAIDLQSELFRTTQESKLIGDILLEQKEITKANKAAILLSQDRVKDEFLAEAMNDIASTEMERISISMRFGAIAVKEGMISIDQLNQALLVQKSEGKENKTKRYLGEILKELFGLSDEDLTHIFNIQKEFEKQRLSLKKALSSYNLETNTNKRLNQLFEYRFSKNKLEAYLRIVKKNEEDVLIPDVISWLDSIGIRFGICDEKVMGAFIKKWETGLEIKIAQGYAPLEPVNESIEFLFKTGVALNTDNADSQVLPFAKKGDILAKRIPYKEGKPGKDVCGFHIASSEYKIIPLSCGEGVMKQGNHFLAEIDGNPTLFKNRTLFLTPNNLSYETKYLTGNIKTDLGVEYQDVNLRVDGSIDTGGKVICHEISVKGDVKGQLSATGSVQIDGNALNNSTAEEQSNIIISGEDIIVKKDIVNRIIITSKSLIAPNSDITSSKVYAFQDILLNNVYSEEGRPTILQIGKNPTLKANTTNQLIDEKKQLLKRLLHEEELEEIDGWFNGKIEVQSNYLEQQTILQELIKLFSDKSFDSFKSFEQKTDELMNRINGTTNHDYSDTLGSTRARQFINELFNDIRNLSQEEQKSHIHEMADIKFGMYRAAVNATQRYENEHNARKEVVLKKVEALMSEIAELKQEIDDLYVKKDYLKLSEAKLIPAVSPTVRVKNQVEKGTIIKGREASLEVAQTIFGVKFSEQRKTAADAFKIVIEGFYE